MSIDDDLAALAALNGLSPSFFDLHGQERRTSPDTQKALLRGNGLDVSSDGAIQNTLAEARYFRDERWFPDEVIVQSQTAAPQNFGLGAQWQLRCDDTDEIVAEGAPADHITLPPLASGVYALSATASGRTEAITVIAAPQRLPDVQSRAGRTRLWGLNLALYGLRSKRNAGVGDYEDLACAAQAAGGQGAAFLGINPLHNMGFFDRDAISPYSPSHRGYLNTSLIALDRIPGEQGGQEGPDSAQFAAIRGAEAVQYAAHKQAHNRALRAAFERFGRQGETSAHKDHAAFRAQADADLLAFARYEALSETHGTDWRVWPQRLAQAAPYDVDFHIWLQWVALGQLSQAQQRAGAAGMGLGLYLDLAVGARRDGAESWCAQSAIAPGVSIGAPPDHLSPQGQNWNLAAYAPRQLKAQRYRPLRRILAQMCRHAGVIRIDHVLGLNRSFWVPDDGSPGGYIRQPFESLLAVIKIEAERHKCLVVGEDLGLVPDGFRETMRAHGFYGYSVLQYEKGEAGGGLASKAIPAQVLSCFATHDTPTLKGYAQARDVDWWHKMEWINADVAEDLRQQRRAEVTAFAKGADFQTSVHAVLARSEAALVAVQLDDILGVLESQNLPGTIDAHPNWRRKYDMDVAALPRHRTLRDTAKLMRDAGRGDLVGGPEQDGKQDGEQNGE